MIIAPKKEINILSSNVAEVETGVSVWSDTETYSAAAVVQLNAPTHKKYKALQDVPADVNPLSDVNATTGIGTYWFDSGSTNYFRAFDELGSSQCVNADSINYKFQTSDVDILPLENLRCATVRIKIINEENSETLLDETVEVRQREVYDWFDWTYAVDDFQTSFYKNLPMAYNSTMEIWIENAESDVSVGHIAFGRSKNYGLTLANPKPISSRRGITSKTRNEFGEIVTRRKARYKRMSITCLVDSNATDLIEDRLEEIVDTPCIFVGDESEGGYKSLLIYGEMKDHDMPISISAKTTYKLDVEGYL